VSGEPEHIGEPDEIDKAGEAGEIDTTDEVRFRRLSLLL
jgi:hypothetical protein